MKLPLQVQRKDLSLFLIPLLVIVLIGAGLRFIALDAALSHDEWYTLDLVARDTFQDMNAQMHADVHLPFYFYLVKAFSAVAGVSDVSLRILSVLLGVAGIVAFGSFTRNNFGDTIAILASSILAVSVFHVAYSQVARMYSLMFLLAVISLSAFFDVIYSRKPPFVLWAAANVALLYTHAFAAFFVLFEAITLFWLRGKIRNPNKVLNIIFIFCVMAVPFGLFVIRQIALKLTGNSYSNWMPQTTPGELYNSFGAFASSSLLVVPFLLIIGLFLWQYRRILWNGRGERVQILLINLLICFFLPMVITLITPLYAYRYYILAYPAFIILLSLALYGLSRINKQLVYASAVIVFFVLTMATGLYLEKNASLASAKHKCIDTIAKEIDAYKQNSTAFVSYRWLNEWVPNHRPTIKAHERLDETFGINTTFVNYYNTDLSPIFKNYTHIMTISPSPRADLFIYLPGSVVEDHYCEGYTYRVYLHPSKNHSVQP